MIFLLKTVIIGATGHYGYVLDGIEKINDIEINGIAPGSKGENVKKLKEKVDEIGFKPEIFDTYINMLDKIKPDLAVVNCYFGDHAQVILDVLNRGIHVFAEKPLATSFSDLEKLKNTFSRQNVHLAAMLGLRYNAAFFTAYNAVKKGAIGEVRLINAQKSYKLGSRGENYKKRELYGGTIPWVGSHGIDWIYWFSGKKFKNVYASHSSKYNKNHNQLEISALCHFVLDKEIFASVNIDFLRPGSASGHGDDRIRVAGTKGVIEVINNKVLLINDQYNGVQKLSSNIDRQIFDDFVAQIRGEGECLIGAEDSLYNTEACLKARLSADDSRLINFS